MADEDVVAQAAVTVEPDLSQFGPMLADAIGPAMADAVSAVNAATSQMGEDAAGIGAGVTAALDEAAAAVAAATTDMGLNIDDVSVSSAAMADAAAAAGDVVGFALADAAAGADDLATGADEAAASLVDLGSEGGAAVMGLGDLIAGVALGDIIADSVQGGVDMALESLGSLATAIPELGEMYFDSFKQLRRGTGMTGEELASVEESARDLYEKIPASLDEAGVAIMRLQQRLGATGDEAEDAGLSLIRFARYTGGSITSTVEEGTKLLNSWNTPIGDATMRLDQLFRVSQETGASSSEMMRMMNRIAPIARGAGVSFEELASMMGLVSEAGIRPMMLMRAFNQINARAVKEGRPAKQVWDELFSGIASGAITAESEMNPFKGTALGIFNLIREGKFDYKALADQVAAGGDTLKQAGDDTASWSSQLAKLTHILQNAVAPLAEGVFNAINTSLVIVLKAAQAVAGAFGDWLRPSLERLFEAGRPLWDLFADIGAAFKAFTATIKEDGGALNAIYNFFWTLTGSESTAQTVVDALSDIGQAFSDLWAAIEPIRDGIGWVFDQIVGGIEALVAANPVAALGLLTAGLTALGGTAIVSGISALSGVLSAVAAGIVQTVPALAPLMAHITGFGSAVAGAGTAVAGAAVPIAAVVGAIAAAGLAFKVAYDNLQPFRDAVDGIAEAFRLNFLVAVTLVSNYIDSTVRPWLSEIGDRFTALWTAIENFDVSNLLGSLGEIGEAVRDAIGSLTEIPNMAVEIVGQLGLAFLNALSSVPIVGPFFEKLKGLFASSIAGMSGAFDLLGALISFDPARFEEGIGKVTTAFRAFVGRLPGVLAEALSTVLGAVGTVLGDWFPQAFTWATDKIREGLPLLFTFLKELPSMIGAMLVEYGPGVIAALGSGMLTLLRAAFVDLPKAVWEALPTILSAIGELASKIPGLLGSVLAGLGGTIKDVLMGLGGVLISWGADLGRMLWQAHKVAFDWVVENAPGILARVGAWLAGLPGVLLGFLGDLGSTLLGWVSAAWDWVVANGPAALARIGTWLAGLPATLLGFLAGLGPTLWEWWLAGWDFLLGVALDALSGVASFFLDTLPRFIFSAIFDFGPRLVTWMQGAFDWLGAHGLEAVAAFRDWLVSLPGTIIGWLWEFDQKLFEWARGAFQAVVDRGPEVLGAIVDWFENAIPAALRAVWALDQKLFEWMKDAFDYVVDHGPEMIAGLIDWFSKLPGTLFDALASAAETATTWVDDVGKRIFNALADFINKHIIDPIREVEVSVFGMGATTPFEGLPRIPRLAEGAIVDQATLAIIGEAGREAVVPLDNAAARARVMGQAGLGGAGLVVNLGGVTVVAPPGADQQWARAVGRTAGEAAAKRLALLAAVRSA